MHIIEDVKKYIAFSNVNFSVVVLPIGFVVAFPNEHWTPQISYRHSITVICILLFTVKSLWKAIHAFR